jgi:hypothetical protein
LRWSILYSLIVVFIFLPLASVYGQGPRTINAVGAITTADGTVIPFTMQFSPGGGPVTGQIDFKSEVPWRKSDTGTCPSTMKLAFAGVFAGGDGGEAHGELTGEEDTICGPTSYQGEWGGGARIVYGTDDILKYGKSDWQGNFYANGTGSGTLHFWYRLKNWDFSNGPSQASWKVTFSPAEFQGEPASPAASEAAPESTEAGSPACTPTVRGLDNLKPGDVISPGAAYRDAAGKEVGIIQDRWYMNGVETNSASWNGQRTVIELQYTCLDHKGGTVTYEIPAYQQPPPGQPPADQSQIQSPADPSQNQPQPQDQPSAPSSNGLLVITTFLGLGALGAGFLGVVGLGAYWITRILKGGTTPKTPPPAGRPAPPRPPQRSAPAAPVQIKPVKSPEKAVSVDKGDAETEKKGGIDAAKEAAEKYGQTLESITEPLNKIKEHLGNDKVLPPKLKENITRYINSLTEPMEKVKERAESWGKEMGKYTDLRDKVTDFTKGLDKNFEEIAKNHQKVLDDLKNLPPGAANAAADLSSALDALGRGADAALDKIPGYKSLGGDKTFELKKSFQEAGKGLQKAIKTIKTSETEAIDLSKNGDKIPGFTSPEMDPEIDRIRTDAGKNRPQSTWDWWKEKVLGKTVDAKTRGFR